MNSISLRRVSTLALMVILCVATPGFAVDGSLALGDLDARIDQAIVRTVNIGAPLYNQGDPAGCYRLYQGALLAIEPLLGHRAELRQEVAKGLRDVEIVPSYAQRATDLRRILDRVLSAVRTSPRPQPTQTSPPSLWARLGGEPAVKAVVHGFVALAAGDPQVDFTRGGRYALDAAGVANLEKLLVELISTVTGGPLKYEGRAMKLVHQGMAITDGQFDALAGDLVIVLKKYNVPQKEADELIAIVASTRTDIVEGQAAARVASPPRPTASAAIPLWTRLGGEPAVTAVVHDFVALAASDPQVDFTRGGRYALDAAGVANLEKLLVELISTVTGGPLKYEGRAMKPVHQGMAITDAQFDALAGDLVVVLKKYNVPKKEADELIGIVASTRKDIVEGQGATTGAPPPPPTAFAAIPLWTRLGGEPAVTAVVHDFVVLAASDPQVDFTRGGKYALDAVGVANLEKLLVELISAVTGGPLKYEGRAMKPVHQAMAITDAQFDALAGDLVVVLKRYNVPKKEADELINIVASTRKDIVGAGPRTQAH